MSLFTLNRIKSAESAPTECSRPAIDRTEILLVADDRRQAEAHVLGLCRRSSVDDVFIARSSAEALDALCRLREYEYRRNGRELRAIMMDPRCETADIPVLTERLYRAGSVRHFPIVRLTDEGAGSFEAVHYHQFEALLDSTRACCVLLWERYRMAA